MGVASYIIIVVVYILLNSRMYIGSFEQRITISVQYWPEILIFLYTEQSYN